MVSSFRRSISLPLSPGPNKPPRSSALHVRSVSLPCRSHPLSSLLRSHLLALRSWLSRPTDPTPAWISSGLSHIDLLHAALDELLLLPDAHDPLRRAAYTPRLLDDFLLLADAYGSLRSALLELKQNKSDVQAAVRRHDAARLASALRSQRRTEKELAGLAAALSPAAKCSQTALAADATEIEVIGMLREAIGATAAASVAIISAAAGISAAATASTAKASSGAVGTWRKLVSSAASFRKRKDWAEEEEDEMGASGKWEQLESCIGDLEGGSERVFRRLVNTRVSLLNILTPSF